MYYIKYLPEDFLVEEIPNERFVKGIVQSPCDYIICGLTKKNYTVERALWQIARALKIDKKRINFAGTKDKRAVTKQLISIFCTKEQGELVERIKGCRSKDIALEFLGYSKEPINLGTLIGNRFIVVVRGVDEKIVNTQKSYAISGNIQKSDVKIKTDEILFPNYFGEQRFGISQNSHRIGICLLKKDFEGAVKEFLVKKTGNKGLNEFSGLVEKNWGSWGKILENEVPKILQTEYIVLRYLERNPKDFMGALRTIHKKIRMLFIHAVQSYVFNLVLSRYLEENTQKSERISGNIRFADVCKGEAIEVAGQKLFFPKIDELNKIKELEFPLIGADINLEGLDEEIKKRVEKILKMEKIKLEDFKLPSSPELEAGGEMRNILNGAKILSVEFLEKIPTSDFYLEKNIKIGKSLSYGMKIIFELPKASYATIFLRSLLGGEVESFVSD